MPRSRHALDALIHRRPLRLPPALDAAAERWASLPPRARTLCGVLAVCLAVGAGEVRVLTAERRWGGDPVEVLLATEDLPAGVTPRVRPATVPPSLEVAGAVDEIDDDALLTLALPQGAILTRGHLDPRGPAAGLDPALRVVPLPVEDGWAIHEGGWVDVWTLETHGQATVVARSRTVLGLDIDDMGRSTALVALHAEEVAAATKGLASGRILLTHAPRPDATSPEPLIP